MVSKCIAAKIHGLIALVAVVVLCGSAEDINDFRFRIVHTTDVHGWVDGHKHDSRYSADFSDFYTFIDCYRKDTLDDGRDFLIFDSGDVIQGTGLSDASVIRGEYLYPILEYIPYDAVTVGNHDLSENIAVDYLYENYIPHWNGSYLSLNVLYINGTGEYSMGQPYKVFESANGARILVFGVLYSLTEYPDNTRVVSVQDTLGSELFSDMMGIPNIDLIISLSHIGATQKENEYIHDAIRSNDNHKTTPLIILAGHTHKIQHLEFFGDPNTFVLESGWQFEVTGLLNFTVSNRSLSDLSYKWIDNNVETYKNELKNASSYISPVKSKEIKDMIQQSSDDLQLNDVFGCSSRTYNRSLPLSSVNSFFYFYCAKLFLTEYFPLVDRSAYLINTVSSPNSLYIGPVTKNDVFKVNPYNSTFFYISNITGAQIIEIETALQRIDPNTGLQELYHCPHVEVNYRYNLMVSDYDRGRVLNYLHEYHPSERFDDFPFPVKESALNTFTEYVKDYMTCEGPSSNGQLPAALGIAIILVVVFLIMCLILICILALLLVFYIISMKKSNIYEDYVALND